MTVHCRQLRVLEFPNEWRYLKSQHPFICPSRSSSRLCVRNFLLVSVFSSHSLLLVLATTLHMWQCDTCELSTLLQVNPRSHPDDSENALPNPAQLLNRPPLLPPAHQSHDASTICASSTAFCPLPALAVSRLCRCLKL